MNMASNILGVCLLFFVFLVEASADGICNRTELTGDTKYIRKWKYVNGRRKTYLFYEPIKKNILECCEGYLQDKRNSTGLANTETPPICIPQCEPPCMHGACVKPNVCECVPGYEFRNGTCKPICSKPCNNGTCVEPETCKCLPGYKITNGIACTPVCSMGCGSGNCISPEVCHCNDGYTLTNGTCEPNCWPPCETGECIAPNICSCGPGYEIIVSNMTICAPICSPACQKGVCVGPNICMCDIGYVMQNGTCQPICSRPCGNGTCVAPETCKCYEGYVRYDENNCVPKCTNGCAFGTCISPEVCLCREGFSWLNGTCKPVCSPPCVNGDCTLSFDCHCNPGYYPQNGVCQPESKWPNINKQSTTIKMVTYVNDEQDEETVVPDSFQNNEGTTWSKTLTTAYNMPITKLDSSPVLWMCYVIPILVLLMVILIAILIWKKRRSIVEFCAGRSYVVSEDQKHTENQHNIPDVTFCAIKERQARREGRNTEMK